ncbi:MAG: FtsX-like permease family protein [Burkholderiales bacterium]
MPLPFELMVALRFLREGRMQSALILIGVMAGVAVVVFITQFLGQLQEALIDRVLGSQAHIVIRPLEEVNRRVIEDPSATAIIEPRAQRLRSVDQWEAIERLAAAAPGVVAVSPLVTGPGFAIRGTAAKSIAVMGVDPERYRRIVKLDQYMTQGAFALQGTDTIIGVELARDLGVRVGDKIRVAAAGNRDDLLTVVGIFDMGNRDLNRRWVFTTLKVAQSLLDLAGGVSNIDLTISDIFTANVVADRLRAQGNLTVDSWMQTNAQLLAALNNQNIMTRLIRSFVIVIVALGIASVLVVSVVQKQKEIGILRAMGASSGRMMTVFLVQGGIVGFVGSLGGIVLGWFLLNVFSKIYKNADGSQLFTPQLDIDLFLIACAVATLVGVASAVLPARRAAKMDPVQAIRA